MLTVWLCMTRSELDNMMAPYDYLCLDHVCLAASGLLEVLGKSAGSEAPAPQRQVFGYLLRCQAPAEAVR